MFMWMVEIFLSENVVVEISLGWGGKWVMSLVVVFWRIWGFGLIVS